MGVSIKVGGAYVPHQVALKQGGAYVSGSVEIKTAGLYVDAGVGGPAPPLVAIVQETPTIELYSPGASTYQYNFPQASTAGSTLVMLATLGYWSTNTITDSAGGTVANGAWTLEIIDDFSGSVGNGDPLNSTADRQHVWVRRNAPAGLTHATLGSSSNISTRPYFREVSGLSNVAPIQRINARNVASQTSIAIAVPGAGFMAALVRHSPSKTPVSASAGSVVRRLDISGGLPYTDLVSEHSIYGISTGARDFNSSWADGAATIGYHGIFIPAAT